MKVLFYQPTPNVMLTARQAIVSTFMFNNIDKKHCVPFFDGYSKTENKFIATFANMHDEKMSSTDFYRFIEHKIHTKEIYQAGFTDKFIFTNKIQSSKGYFFQENNDFCLWYPSPDCIPSPWGNGIPHELLKLWWLFETVDFDILGYTFTDDRDTFLDLEKLTSVKKSISKIGGVSSESTNIYDTVEGFLNFFTHDVFKYYILQHGFVEHISYSQKSVEVAHRGLQYLYQKTADVWNSDISSEALDKEFYDMIENNRTEDILWWMTRKCTDDPRITVSYGKKIGLFNDPHASLYYGCSDVSGFKNLLKERQYYKVQKDFENVDRLKKEIYAKFNMNIEDSKDMQYWRKSR